MLGTVLETNLFIHLSLLCTTKLKTKNSCGGTCKDIASRSLIFAGAAWIIVSLAAVFSIITQRSSPQEERFVTILKTAARETTWINVK